MRNLFPAGLFIIIFVFFIPRLQAQTIVDYFQKIRKNEAELTAFIAQMPKGGDLHNHYSGSVYAETYIKSLEDADYCLNPATLELSKPGPHGECPSLSFSKISTIKKTVGDSQYELLKSRLVRLWSTKEYDQVHTDAREEHFFESFGNFSTAADLNYKEGLQELKNRAKAENVSYLEVMLPIILCNKPEKKEDKFNNADTINFYNDLLIKIGQKQDKAALMPVIDYLYKKINSEFPVLQTAVSANQWVDSLHNNFIGEDTAFTMRYLAFTLRFGDPLQTFINLISAFETVRQSKSHNIVGLNFVAPETHTISMRDYWLHMQLFSLCKSKTEGVKFSLHAGELTEGFVKPEELKWHISSAVYDAGANRIGHGVDIAYEKDSYKLLNYMSSKQIPIEINLLSNEFILGVKGDKHPILLYKHFNVPIVISTDDPGVSRTSLTEQFVLLVKRYDEISYSDLKHFIYNSIKFSFINDPKIKEQIAKDLDRRFNIFEKYIMENKPKN